jgi:Tfp pilus assembly pilus retraction ATPase PilT
MASDYKKEFEDLVDTMVKEDASDLHLAEGRQPIIRVASFLVPLVKHPVLSHADMRSILDEVLDAQKKEIFLEKKEVDFAYNGNNQISRKCLF